MKHTYTITGMTCNGCRSSVEKALNSIKGIEAVVSLDPPIATLLMKNHMPLVQLQETLSKAGKYSISMEVPTDTISEISNEPAIKSCCSSNKPQEKSTVTLPPNAQGKYYCPMHCEGEKVYDKPGDCPVCGMDLVKEAAIVSSKAMYTCPMHPEVIQEGPGSCPICGMDLVPMEPTDSEENKVYDDLVRKMKIAVVFTVPIFIIAMSDMIPNNPLMIMMDAS